MSSKSDRSLVHWSFMGSRRASLLPLPDFQSGAERTAQTFADWGYPIRLVGADQFLDALHVAQRQRYKTDADDGAPFTRATPVFLSSDSHPLFDGILANRMGEHLWDTRF